MSKFEKPFPLGRGWGRLPFKICLPQISPCLPQIFLSLPLFHSSSLCLFDSPKKDPHVRCISAATKPFPLGRGWGRPRLLVF